MCSGLNTRTGSPHRSTEPLRTSQKCASGMSAWIVATSESLIPFPVVARLSPLKVEWLSACHQQSKFYSPFGPMYTYLRIHAAKLSIYFRLREKAIRFKNTRPVARRQRSGGETLPVLYQKGERQKRHQGALRSPPAPVLARPGEASGCASCGLVSALDTPKPIAA